MKQKSTRYSRFVSSHFIEDFFPNQFTLFRFLNNVALKANSNVSTSISRFAVCFRSYETLQFRLPNITNLAKSSSHYTAIKCIVRRCACVILYYSSSYNYLSHRHLTKKKNNYADTIIRCSSVHCDGECISDTVLGRQSTNCVQCFFLGFACTSSSLAAWVWHTPCVRVTFARIDHLRRLPSRSTVGWSNTTELISRSRKISCWYTRNVYHFGLCNYDNWRNYYSLKSASNTPLDSESNSRGGMESP
jgi:hypothetical protein